MADVIDKRTFEYLPSVNTPDYSPADFIILSLGRDNSDLAALAGIPKRYWKVEGDRLAEMDDAEKTAKDAVFLVEARPRAKERLRAQIAAFIEAHYSAQTLAIFALTPPDDEAEAVSAWLITVLDHLGAKGKSVV